MEKIILVQKNSNGRVKFITLTLENDTISRVWGLTGGKTQSTSNTYGYINKGKANELPPAEAALADFERIKETKMREGYLLTERLEELPDFNNTTINLDDLPVQFCCSKPHSSISKAKCNKLIKEKLDRFFIKENGLCHYILITSVGDVKIYTRRIEDHTRKYPSIVQYVESLNLPPNTLLVTEFTIDPELEIPHMDGYSLMSSISKSDTLAGEVLESVEQSLSLQVEHRVVAVVFNILFSAGEDLTGFEYSEILEIMLEKDRHTIGDGGEHSDIILPRELEFDSYNEAYAWTEENSDQYEGLVLWNQDENAEITYNGKPNRRACYKIKSVKDDDVIAYDYKEGTGAKQGKIGSLYIGKYNAEGEMVPMGRVGSGLKIKQGECEIDYWKLPCVIEISYDQRFPTGAYQFPRFTGKVHLEKIPSDVVVDEKGF